MPNGFINVPDWFSWANQGAGAAVADLDNDGQSDLVVLLVDDAPNQNQGLYRVGKALANDGAPGAGVVHALPRRHQRGAICGDLGADRAGLKDNRSPCAIL